MVRTCIIPSNILTPGLFCSLAAQLFARLWQFNVGMMVIMDMYKL